MNSRKSAYEANLSPSTHYVDIHGKSLDVLEAPNGQIYIPLDDIRRTGFTIFHRDDYKPSKITTPMIHKEFQLYMLNKAKEYMLEYCTAIKTKEIMETIKECERQFLDNSTSEETIANGHRKPYASTQLLLTSPPAAPKPEPAKKWGQPPAAKKSPSSSRPAEPAKSKKSQSADSSSESGSDGDKIFNRANYMEVVKLPFNVPVAMRMRFVGETKGFATLLDNDQLMAELQREMDATGTKLGTVGRPKLGVLGMIQYEGQWRRAIVCKTQPLKVMLTESNHVTGCKELMEIPDSVRVVPSQFVRLLYRQSVGLKVGDVAMVSAFKQTQDNTSYFVTLGPADKPQPVQVKSPQKVQKSPQQVQQPKFGRSPAKKDDDDEWEATEEDDVKSVKEFLQVPAKRTVRDGERIVLVDFNDTHMFVKNEECARLSTQLTRHISEIVDRMEKLKSCKKNQMVLCQAEGETSYFRGAVVHVAKDTAVVDFIDSAVGECAVAVAAMRNVDDFLANSPAAIIAMRAFDGFSELLEHDPVLQHLKELCEKRHKLVVHNSMDLKDKDGELLSEVLIALGQEKKKKKKPQPVEEKPKPAPVVPDDRLWYSSMDHLKLELGTGSYMVFSFLALDQITMISMSERDVNLFTEMGSLQVDDAEPAYSPAMDEMCLALWAEGNDEPMWNRGVVIDEQKDDPMILFCDYGNSARVSKANLRKMPKEMTLVPILGVDCELVGLSKVKDAFAKLSDKITDGDTVEAEVIGYNSATKKYSIRIPELYADIGL